MHSCGFEARDHRVHVRRVAAVLVRPAAVNACPATKIALLPASGWMPKYGPIDWRAAGVDRGRVIHRAVEREDQPIRMACRRSQSAT